MARHGHLLLHGWGSSTCVGPGSVQTHQDLVGCLRWLLWRPRNINHSIFGTTGASSSSTQSKHLPGWWDLLGGDTSVTPEARWGFLVSVLLPEVLALFQEGLCWCQQLLPGGFQP